jgi:hypothetical protein
MAEPNREPDAPPADRLPDVPDPARIEPLEERPEVAEAILNDTTVPGLPVTGRGGPDPDTPRFEAPGPGDPVP